MLNGGQKIEESDAFQEAVLRERERIRGEQEVRNCSVDVQKLAYLWWVLQQEYLRINSEKRRLEEEKAQFELERQRFSEQAALFEKQRAEERQQAEIKRQSEETLAQVTPEVKEAVPKKRKTKKKSAEIVPVQDSSATAPTSELAPTLASAVAVEPLVSTLSPQARPSFEEPPLGSPLSISSAPTDEASPKLAPHPPAAPLNGGAFVTRLAKRYSRGSIASEAEPLSPSPEKKSTSMIVEEPAEPGAKSPLRKSSEEEVRPAVSPLVELAPRRASASRIAAGVTLAQSPARSIVAATPQGSLVQESASAYEDSRPTSRAVHDMKLAAEAAIESGLVVSDKNAKAI